MFLDVFNMFNNGLDSGLIRRIRVTVDILVEKVHHDNTLVFLYFQ